MPALQTTARTSTAEIILPAMLLRGTALPEVKLTASAVGYSNRPELITGYPLKPVIAAGTTGKRGRPAKPVNATEFYVWTQAGETRHTGPNGQRSTKPVCKYVEVTGAPVHIPGYAKLDLFIRQDEVMSPGYFEVIDGYIGELGGDGKTRREAIDCASKTLWNEYHNLVKMFE